MRLLVISNRQVENATFFQNPEDLETELAISDVDTLLFAFWSWKVPTHILNKYKCYGLHTGPLLEGKGKGGSPIDNLQDLDIEWTTLCCFEMTEKIDEGRVVLAIPIYLDAPKINVISQIDDFLEWIVPYLQQDNSAIPERFKRLPNAH